MVVSLAKVIAIGRDPLRLDFLQHPFPLDVQADGVGVPGAHAADWPDALDQQVAPDVPAVQAFGLPGDELAGHLALGRLRPSSRLQSGCLPLNADRGGQVQRAATPRLPDWQPSQIAAALLQNTILVAARRRLLQNLQNDSGGIRAPEPSRTRIRLL